MSELALPMPVAAVIRAVNKSDTEGFLNLFTADGVVDDWGKRYLGRRAIQEWSNRELIGAKGVMHAKSFSTMGTTITLIADCKSEYFNGIGAFVFTLNDGKIEKLQITSEKQSLFTFLASIRVIITPDIR